MNCIYLTVEEVLYIHDSQINRYGGSDGVRDNGAIESAIARPQSGYYDTIIDEAAALWESLSQNHPFVDGNKRTAFAATFTFLDINGIDITANPEDTYEFISEAFEKREMNHSTLSNWLQENTRHRVQERERNLVQPQRDRDDDWDRER